MIIEKFGDRTCAESGRHHHDGAEDEIAPESSTQVHFIHRIQLNDRGTKPLVKENLNETYKRKRKRNKPKVIRNKETGQQNEETEGYGLLPPKLSC